MPHRLRVSGLLVYENESRLAPGTGVELKGVFPFNACVTYSQIIIRLTGAMRSDLRLPVCRVLIITVLRHLFKMTFQGSKLFRFPNLT